MLRPGVRSPRYKCPGLELEPVCLGEVRLHLRLSLLQGGSREQRRPQHDACIYGESSCVLRELEEEGSADRSAVL